MECPSTLLITVFVLKYFLSDISIDASDPFCSMFIEKSNGWDQFLELLAPGAEGLQG